MIKNLLLFSVALLGFAYSSFATHNVSTYLGAKHISGNSYEIYGHVLRDCSGVSGPQSLVVNLSTGISVTLQKATSSFIDGINSACMASLPTTTCNGGVMPGYELITYSAITTLPANSTITISWSSCCRNTSVNLIGQQGIYTETIVNTSNDNSSPKLPFTKAFIWDPNQAFTMDVSAFDIDGDSLTYTFTSALSASTTPVSYNAGYTASNPIPGLSLSSSGQLTYVPTSSIIGNYTIAYLIQEYDKSTGALKGSILNEIQFTMGNLPNGTVSNLITNTGIINSTGGTISGDSIYMCEGDSFSFDISFSSTGGKPVVNQLVLDGSNLITSGNISGNTLDINFSVTPTITSGTYLISIMLEDTACKYSTISHYTFALFVESAISISAVSHTICPGDSVLLVANGTNASNFNWTPSTGLSCPTCPSTQASPNATTTYTVTASQPNANCGNSDSVIVYLDTVRTIEGIALSSTMQDYELEKVYLIEYNPMDSTVTAIDSTITDTTGYFTFQTSSPKAFVKIAPDSSTYPNEIPTYYSQSAFFLGADSIEIAPCSSFFDSLITIAGTNPGGPGFISGNVYQGAGKKEGVGDPVQNVDFLLKNDQGEIVQHWKSDGDGKIQFSNLPYGMYYVYVDLPNIDNDNPPSIKVDGFTYLNTYNFKLNSKELVRENPNSVNELESPSVSIYPNPVSDKLFLKGAKQIDYLILTIHGQLIQEGVAHYQGEAINTGDLKPGTYLIQIHEKGNTETIRFIKQ